MCHTTVAHLKMAIQSSEHHYCNIEGNIPLYSVSTVGPDECEYWLKDEKMI